MREAAADLEFETAARLRDEIKRLRETELAIADDPLATQSQVEDRAGVSQAAPKYGAAGNLPPVVASAPVQVDPRTKAGAFGEKIRGPHKPTLDEMGPHAERGLPVDRPMPSRPARTIDVDDKSVHQKGPRRGRSRKTGRPGA